jgi:hypothetical protein
VMVHMPRPLVSAYFVKYRSKPEMKSFDQTYVPVPAGPVAFCVRIESIVLFPTVIDKCGIVT